MATKEQVIALHRKYPKLTSVQIAERLGCLPEYVRSTFYRQGLTLAGGKTNTKKKSRAA